MGRVGKVTVAHSEEALCPGLGWRLSAQLLLSGLLSLQFTVGSDEEESSSTLAPARFHVEEECGVLSPMPRFADLLQDKGPASLHR